MDPELILSDIRDYTGNIQYNVQYNGAVIQQLNETTLAMNALLTQIHDWVSFSSCLLFMVFLALMMISCIYMSGIGRIWRRDK